MQMYLLPRRKVGNANVKRSLAMQINVNFMVITLASPAARCNKRQTEQDQDQTQPTSDPCHLLLHKQQVVRAKKNEEGKAEAKSQLNVY